MRTILDSTPVALENPSDYEARANLMWSSAVNTMGLLNRGKNSAWSLYGCETIAEELFHVSYREAVAVIFPQWLRAMSNYFGDEVYNYAVNVLKVNPDSRNREQVIEEGLALTENIFKQYGIPGTFNEIAVVPEEEVIREILEEFEEDDILTRDEVKGMIFSCIK